MAGLIRFYDDTFRPIVTYFLGHPVYSKGAPKLCLLNIL